VRQKIVSIFNRRAKTLKDELIIEAKAMMTDDVPITLQVQECLDAGMTIAEGSEYTNIYHEGFRLIANITMISKFHQNIKIREEASKFLAEFDRRGSVGSIFQDALRFYMLNPVKEKRLHPRRKADRGFRFLRQHEKQRIEELAQRTDMKEEETSEVKRIRASIVGDKVATADYEKIAKISQIYKPSTIERQGRSKQGWRRINGKLHADVQILLGRADVKDSDKQQALKYLAKIDDGLMKTIDLIDLNRLVASNRLNKRERAKRIEAYDTFENAVMIACEACDNLRDMEVYIRELKRNDLVIRLNSSMTMLLQIQRKLMGDDNDNEG
jgi:hypothetical protein